MPSNKINTTFPIFFLLLLFCGITLYGQNNSSLYDWFDSKTGKENLAINNGKLLLNYDRVINNNDRFYFSEYISGTVIYDNQTYNNITLNYDIYNDDLIIKPNGNNDKTSDFIGGYYEEGIVGNQLGFYIKHVKTRTERINSDGPYDDFTEKSHYVLNYKNDFYKINSKKNIIDIFPEYKKLINEYYSTNDYMIKLDKAKFLTNLFTYLNTNIK